MLKVFGDFETRSEEPIEHGTENYLRHPSADILFYTYLIEDEEGKPSKVQIWYAGDELPRFFTHPEEFLHYEHNNQFDERVKRYLGPKYGIKEAPLDNQVDVMALCGRYTFPQALEKAAIVIDADVKKDKAGKALIKKICCPPFKYTHDEFRRFVLYGLDDTRAMYSTVKKLPLDHLSKWEHEVWKLTVRMNQRGLPLDVYGIKAILKCADAYKKTGTLELRTVTRGQVQTPGQIARIKAFLKREFKLDLPNLQAETVDQLLKSDISPKAKKVLQLRKDLGPAAVKKFQKLKEVNCDGFCYDNMRYYGGHTGRWAGMGFQLQNLPRAKSKDPEALLKAFHDGSIMERGSVIEHARKLVRHMLCAHLGHHIGVNDYSSIENRFLVWYTDDQKSLQLFRDGGCQYRDMASARYKVSYDEVTDDQRFVGKVIILGCGYGMGGDKFKKTAEGWGLDLSLSDSIEAVQAYRTKYPLVPKMWYGTFSAACAAVRHPGKTFEMFKCRFRVIADHTGRRWLKLTLPNKNSIFYCEPYLEGDFRPQLCYAGINGYTKKWDTRKRIIPGLLVENIIQATAREYMAEGAIALENEGIEVIGLVHDEALNNLDNDWIMEQGGAEQASKVLGNIMCYERPWCPGLPMSADGYISKNYKKD